MCNLPHGFDIYLVNITTMRKILQVCVAFSEKLNFKELEIAKIQTVGAVLDLSIDSQINNSAANLGKSFIAFLYLIHKYDIYNSLNLTLSLQILFLSISHPRIHPEC